MDMLGEVGQGFHPSSPQKAVVSCTVCWVRTQEEYVCVTVNQLVMTRTIYSNPAVAAGTVVLCTQTDYLAPPPNSSFPQPVLRPPRSMQVPSIAAPQCREES